MSTPRTSERPRRLGMLTPSSNTTLEPVTSAMLAGYSGATAHFSRFKVTEIALSDQALKQFDTSEIMRAAALLADAKVDCIAWNGTSASWLGFDSDERLVAEIETRTGIRAGTTVLAYRELFATKAARRIGLVTPYRADVQGRIVATWSAAGLPCGAERHLDLQDNFSFAEVGEAEIETMIRDVVREGADAVAIVCTNMAGARVAARLETELGVPIYDSVAVTLWKSLAVAGADPAGIAGWGSVFAQPTSR